MHLVIPFETYVDAALGGEPLDIHGSGSTFRNFDGRSFWRGTTSYPWTWWHLSNLEAAFGVEPLDIHGSGGNVRNVCGSSFWRGTP